MKKIRCFCDITEIICRIEKELCSLLRKKHFSHGCRENRCENRCIEDICSCEGESKQKCKR